MTTLQTSRHPYGLSPDATFCLARLYEMLSSPRDIIEYLHVQVSAETLEELKDREVIFEAQISYFSRLHRKKKVGYLLTFFGVEVAHRCYKWDASKYEEELSA